MKNLLKHVRNFCIIAHIDHGKSTLADRFLELTGTVETRKMKAQYLDQLELERERGITIKMAPVRMIYPINQVEYVLNLIDTPGHSDFSYEVSRALAAVEGAILLVDGTQGIQAQTLANLRAAQEAGLTIVGAVNKIDLLRPDNCNDNDDRLNKVIYEMVKLLHVPENEIYLVSAKTGEGVEDLLNGVIDRVLPPTAYSRDEQPRALVFDSFYDAHKGIIASVRVFSGEFITSKKAMFIATNQQFKIKELGYFVPELTTAHALSNGDIGYIATGIKDPKQVNTGDTIAEFKIKPLEGYKEPNPVVFVSFYPEDGSDYEALNQGLRKLKLNDSSLSIEYDRSNVLGKGFKVGFLGKLHYEIAAERLLQEFGIETVHTMPSVLYRIKTSKGWSEIVRPEDSPADADEIWEPMVSMEVVLPSGYMNALLAVARQFRMRDISTDIVGENVKITARMPLAELISDFDDVLKSLSKGYGSFSYECEEYERADVVKVDILVSGEQVPGMSRFFPRETALQEARKMAKRLRTLLPRKQYVQPVQATVNGRVVARENIPAFRKNVTGHLYGGDRTRKMKLWKKQKRGKKKLEQLGQMRIDAKVFKELLKK